MKKTNISYTKNHLSELIHLVREGESILIMDRETPVAKLEPVIYSKSSHDTWLSDKVARGILSRPRKKQKVPLLVGWKPARTESGIDPLDALNDDREDRV